MRRGIVAFMAAAAISWAAPARAQFVSGSDGSYGPINLTSGTTNIPLPPNGIINATTIDIASGATLTFTKNDLNTPVYLLATGNVVIAGTINVDGGPGGNNPPAAGLAGPGGFDGGVPGILGASAGAGKGPGGGSPGPDDGSAGGAGGGGYGTQSTTALTAGDGPTYGSPLLVPLVGGSGGGGTDGNPGLGGGGGGGAILIASTTSISFTGIIYARGGAGQVNFKYNGGSGGAIRLVAPVVSGNGLLNVTGGGYYTAGSGRSRVDTFDRSNLSVNFDPDGTGAIGALLSVFPSPLPKLNIVQAAGTNIAEGSGSVQIILPTDTNPNQIVRVQARDFTGLVPIRVALIPDNGTALFYDDNIDMSGGNPSTKDVNVVFPTNTVVNVQAWTR